jgi:hypothetical protein
MKIQPRNVRFF